MFQKKIRVLHMGCAWEVVGGVGNVCSSAGPLLVCSLVLCAGSVRTPLALGSDVRALASLLEKGKSILLIEQITLS